ncbi:MAG TPA: hypothetical protein VNH11_24640 [Pirellulales bacterium]|nr:hypothetical protein [Pirellulales bacterium]
MSEVPRGAFDAPPCNHCCFGLIVTGKGEREFLPSLFSALAACAGCSFEVLRKIDQRGVIGEKKRLRMVGRGSLIPDKDAVELGLTARGFLKNQPCRFLIVLDDVERDRRGELQAIWERYRTAIDTMLRPEERSRASVHFFANMLEAYYFANYEAVNAALGTAVLPSDHAGDVEDIPHPKHELERAARAAGTIFKERQDGASIVQKLDVAYVLSRHDCCAFLRSLFAWCVKHLLASCPIWDAAVSEAFALGGGIQAELTRHQ